MPLMPEKSDALGSFAFLYVSGFMVHPSDKEKRDQFLQWVMAKLHCDLEEEEIAYSLEGLKTLVAGAARGVGNDLDRATLPGMMAGEVLLYVLRGHLSGISLFGIDKAQYMTSEFLRSTHARDGTPYVINGRGAGRDSVLTAWAAFRSVAHYWAAWNIVNYDLNDCRTDEVLSWVADHPRNFLGIAQGLLLSACECKLPQSELRLQNRADAWELEGITPSTVELSPFSARELEMLGRFVPRYR